MHTLGYRFRPWRGDTALADGASILDYLRDTAREYGVDRHIRYGHEVVGRLGLHDGALDGDVRGRRRDPDDHRRLPVVVQRLLRLRRGLHARSSRGRSASRGQVVHPQHWPEDLDYAGKRVVVIGSGATAVTLVPALAAAGAGHVTMLQRSPTYVIPVPGKDALKRPADRAGRRAGVVRGHPLEEHRAPGRALPAEPAPPRPGAPGGPQGQRRPAAARLRRRHPLQADLRPVGPADVPRARRRPVRGDPGRLGRGGHRPDRAPSPRPASSSPPGSTWTPTSW